MNISHKLWTVSNVKGVSLVLYYTESNSKISALRLPVPSMPSPIYSSYYAKYIWPSGSKELYVLVITKITTPRYKDTTSSNILAAEIGPIHLSKKTKIGFITLVQWQAKLKSPTNALKTGFWQVTRSLTIRTMDMNIWATLDPDSRLGCFQRSHLWSFCRSSVRSLIIHKSTIDSIRAIL